MGEKKGSTDQKNQNRFFYENENEVHVTVCRTKTEVLSAGDFNRLFCNGWMDVACFVRGRMRKPEQSEAQ